MPSLSASDYTTYLKFKAAVASPIRPDIQTRTNVTLSPSVLNAMTLTSQAAFTTTPRTSASNVLSATVSAVTSTPVTAARTDIITAAAGSTNLITYTTSQEHGLTTGDVITITGLTQNTLALTPNRTNASVTVTGTTTFTIAVTGIGAGTSSTGNGSITGRVYYTTSVANGLIAGDVISITGITTFTASGATVLAAPTATTFVLSSVTTGSAVSVQTGTITGLVYYTTSAAHGLSAGSLPGNTSLLITGLSGTSFNTSGIRSIFRAPSTTVFVLNNGLTGTALTTQTGVLTLITIVNPNNTLTGLSRVIGMPSSRTNNPKSLSTLSWTSGTSGSVGSTSSSKFQQPGGLPRAGVVATYTRLPTGAGWGTNNH